MSGPDIVEGTWFVEDENGIQKHMRDVEFQEEFEPIP